MAGDGTVRVVGLSTPVEKGLTCCPLTSRLHQKDLGIFHRRALSPQRCCVLCPSRKLNLKLLNPASV